MSWATVSLQEVCTFENGDRGKNYPSKSTLIDEGIPFVNAGNLKEGAIGHEDLSFISQEHFDRLSNGKFSKGDFLFCLRGTLGKSAFVDREIHGAIASSLIIIRPTDQIHPAFLNCYLKSALCAEQIDLYKNGAAQPNLAAASLKNFKIPLPQLEEQKRIAGILDQADALRRLRTRALDKLNTLGQAIFHEMFGDWRVEKRNWPLVKLGDHLEFLTSGSRGWAKYYSDHGAKFIRIQNVKRNAFDMADMAYVSPPDSAEAKRTKVKAGDVLMSITADLGRTAVVPNDIGDAHINQHLAILRLKEMHPRYVSAALSSPAGQAEILKKNREGVKAGLNFEDVRSVSLPSPPMEIQMRFCERLDTLVKTTEYATAALKQQQSLFASLQHRAFRGEL